MSGRAVLVAGVGNRFRGDDAVGPLVAGRVAGRVAAAGLPGVRVIELVEPVDLLHHLAGYGLVVVVDAVRGGHPPGSIRTDLVVAGPLPAPGRGGWTHTVGIAEVIELARALDLLPGRLLVVGVEAASFTAGAALSAPVEAAVDGAVTAVINELRVPCRVPPA